MWQVKLTKTITEFAEENGLHFLMNRLSVRYDDGKYIPKMFIEVTADESTGESLVVLSVQKRSNEGRLLRSVLSFKPNSKFQQKVKAALTAVYGIS